MLLTYLCIYFPKYECHILIWINQYTGYTRQAYYSVTIDFDIRRCWQCNVQHYIFTVHNWAMWITTHCWGDFCSGRNKQLALGVKIAALWESPRDGRMGWRGSGWQWWVDRCCIATEPAEIERVFVATNGIVHIFYCNPWLEPSDRGHCVLLDITALMTVGS